VKTPDKYRFSLQWGAVTAEKVRAGDFLESLGNRKSEFVVVAVTEYLAAHPEALPSGKIRIVVKPNIAREQLEAMVRAIVAERMADIAVPVASKHGGLASDSAFGEAEANIAAMLENLDVFSQ
jgi:hypothetical protein